MTTHKEWRLNGIGPFDGYGKVWLFVMPDQVKWVWGQYGMGTGYGVVGIVIISHTDPYIYHMSTFLQATPDYIASPSSSYASSQVPSPASFSSGGRKQPPKS